MTRPFSKAATTHVQQVAQLQSRGMAVENPTLAAFHLQHLNYYRLGAYWLPFEADHATHRFREGTSFAEVLGLYFFDRALRLLVLDAVACVEVSVRSQWAYQMAHHHGPHAHLDPSLAQHRHRWDKQLKRLEEEVSRSEEGFIKHFTETYEEVLPPIWASCEVMSLGLLSDWFSNLKPMPTRRAIAKVYAVDERVLGSWLHHLSMLRNTCAHHSRLWNREFTITPALPRHKPETLLAQCQPASRKLYNSLVVLLHLMDLVAPHHLWRSRLKALLAQHQPPLEAMDFPTHWASLPIWVRPEPTPAAPL